MEYKEIIFEIVPVGKPRMTQSDKWKKRAVVERYFAYRDAIKLQANLLGFELTGELEITFYLSVPKSNAKMQKSMHLQPHTSKPDIDNLLKAFLDCFGEDKTVHTVKAKKIWTIENPHIIVRYPLV